MQEERMELNNLCGTNRHCQPEVHRKRVPFISNNKFKQHMEVVLKNTGIVSLLRLCVEKHNFTKRLHVLQAFHKQHTTVR